MRVNLESSVWTDAEFVALSEAIGMDEFGTIGRCAKLWNHCYGARSATVSVRLASAITKVANFADALVECELATRIDDNTIELRGVKKRIAFLMKQAERGSKGGNQKRKNAVANAKHSASSAGSTRLANSLTLTLTPSPSPSQNVASPPKPARKPPSGHQVAIDCFEQAYRAAYGVGATWNGRSAKGISSLVKAHGSDEVCRRIGLLFSSPPAWLKPPCDVGTLVQHFDKLVPAQPSRPDPRYGRLEPHEDYDPPGEVPL